MKNIPALIGRSVNGEEQLLKDGISVKDLRSGIKELKNLLENFEKKNKKLASNQAKKPAHTDQPKENLSSLLPTLRRFVVRRHQYVSLAFSNQAKLRKILKPSCLRFVSSVLLVFIFLFSLLGQLFNL